MLRVWIGIVALLLSCAGAPAQPTGIAEQRTRTLLQNDQVNVREQVFAPGSRTAPANYPNSFVYPLTDGTLVITHPGRTPFEMSFRAGEALWLPAQAATIANETGKEIRALVVEIMAPAPKRAGAGVEAGAKSAGKARSSRAGPKQKAGTPAKAAIKSAGAKPAADKKK